MLQIVLLALISVLIGSFVARRVSHRDELIDKKWDLVFLEQEVETISKAFYKLQADFKLLTNHLKLDFENPVRRIKKQDEKQSN